MRYNLTGKNFEVTASMEAVLAKKLAKLDKFFTEGTVANVSLSAKKDNHKVEITVPIKGAAIRCEQEGPDYYAVIDDVVSAMENQITKYRGKLLDYYHSGSGLNPSYTEEAEPEEAAIKIVKTKRFAVKPMDAVEACLQMEMLGHDFYVFRNGETDEVNVVYKRHGGTYGLIEPTLVDEED